MDALSRTIRTDDELRRLHPGEHGLGVVEALQACARAQAAPHGWNRPRRQADVRAGRPMSRRGGTTVPRSRWREPDFPARKSPAVCAGAAVVGPTRPFPLRRLRPPSAAAGARLRTPSAPGRSRGSTLARSALLASGPLRALSLMPFTHAPDCSLAAATTVPPGHMQKVYAPRPSGLWTGELVVGGPQGRMPRRAAVLGCVDVGLQVLDGAHADGERLAFHARPGVAKRAEGVTRRMAYRGEDQGVRAQAGRARRCGRPREQAAVSGSPGAPDAGRACACQAAWHGRRRLRRARPRSIRAACRMRKPAAFAFYLFP